MEGFSDNEIRNLVFHIGAGATEENLRKAISFQFQLVPALVQEFGIGEHNPKTAQHFGPSAVFLPVSRDNPSFRRHRRGLGRGHLK